MHVFTLSAHQLALHVYSSSYVLSVAIIAHDAYSARLLVHLRLHTIHRAIFFVGGGESCSLSEVSRSVTEL